MTIFRLKLIRWKYVMPRLALVLIVAVLFRFGLDPVLKWAIVASGESAVGAKIDLASVETSLRTGEIVLSELAVTNPMSPLRNLLQADRAHLYLDINALLHKRLVIRDGTLRGLRFDTDRETSGELAQSSETRTQATDDGGASVLSSWLDGTDQLAAEWFDQLTARFDTDLADQLETLRVAKELEDRWPKQYDEMRGRVESLQQNIKELEKGLREVRKNPLRHLERIGQLQQQRVATQSDLQALQQQIEQLPRQAEADRRAIAAAREHDEQFLREKLQVTNLNGEGLSETLLGETVNERLVSALQWVSWARRQMPAGGAKPQAVRGRGTTVLFREARPRYLIEKLQLEGEASLGGELLQIAGTLTGATSEPHLWADPMRISLRGSGATALSLEATLDRRKAVAVDHLQFNCPQLAMPSRTLGNSEKLAIKIAPGNASVRIDLTLTDDQLAGEIFFNQPSVRLTVDADLKKNRHLVTAFEQALASVSQVEAQVTLAGTLQKPQVSLHSDLGPQLAAGMNTAIQRLVQRRGQELLAKTQAKVDDQLQRLSQARQQGQQELLAKLGEHQKLLGQLAALSGGGTGKLSTARLGQSFGLGTQRR